MPAAVKAYLDSLNTSTAARAEAWNALNESADGAEAKARLDALPFNTAVKAKLWDLASGVEDRSTPPAVPTPPKYPMAFLGNSPVQDAVLAGVKGWVAAGPTQVRHGLDDLAQAELSRMHPEQPQKGSYARGLNRLIVGSGVTAMPMVAPEALPAIAAAPGAAALTATAGIAANAAVPPIARALGATPDQADLAGTVSGIGAGTATAKLGVPALARWSTTRSARSMGDAYQAKVRDIQAALGVNAEDVHRALPFYEALHENGVPIVGKEAGGGAVDQLKKAGDLAVTQIEDHVRDIVSQFPQATAPPSARAILARVEQMPGSTAEDVAAAQQVIDRFGLNQPQSLTRAESIRARLNAENKSVLEGTGVRQRTSVSSNPTYVAKQEAANQLREGIYGTLEDNGVEGIRELRQEEGSVLRLRNAADPATRGLRSESTVARTGDTSLLRRVGQRLGPMVGAGAGAFVSGGNPVVAAGGAEVGREITSGLVGKNLSKNQLLERAFQQSFTSTPPMSTQGFRMPQVATMPPSGGGPQTPPAAPGSPRLLAGPSPASLPAAPPVRQGEVVEPPRRPRRK